MACILPDFTEIGGALDFEFVIIGSGAGGGFAAQNLVKAGKRVLMLERGPDPYHPRMDSTGRPFKHVIDQTLYKRNGSASKLFMGHGLGGSTSIYGAVLLRPKKEDFSPGQHLSQFLHSEDHHWPIAYEEMLPWFEKVEAHFSLRPFEPGVLQSDIPLAPINEEITRRWALHGLKPGILPLAIDPEKCLQCEDCPGYVCPTQARGSTRQSLVELERTYENFTLWPDTEVLKIDRHKPEVHYRRMGDSRMDIVRADKVILSAGAINSAAILLRSGFGDDFPALGKCFMYHAGAVVFALFKNPTQAGQRFVKQIGLDEYYFGDQELPHKLGVIQSLPTPKAATKPIRNHLYLMMATVEDLPQFSNKVELGGDGRIQVHHKFHEYDNFRSAGAKRILRSLMHQAGALQSFAATAQMNKTHVGHQVGTIRFGVSPKTSVLDSWCRPHGMEHLFVLDGGFLPTSMGASPALTIMANALRVTDYIIQQN